MTKFSPATLEAWPAHFDGFGKFEGSCALERSGTVICRVWIRFLTLAVGLCARSALERRSGDSGREEGATLPSAGAAKADFRL